jgi:undecaprenyl-diphosphatase
VVKGIVLSVIRRRIDPADTYAKLGWLLVIGTIPAGILGLLFQDQFKSLFSSPVVVSLFLGLNGILLLCAELLRRKKAAGEDAQADEQIAAMGFSKAVKIGFAQALALFPGFSRTGSTLGGGLLVGLDHESSARFAFLLATPIILAAAVLKLPELIHNGGSYPIAPVVIGALISAIAAYLSVRFLTKYFKTKTLMPFAIYCLATGVLSALILLVR